MKQLFIALALIAVCAHCAVVFDLSRGHESIAESVLAALDQTANPCDDFYQYACGGWLKNTSIPEDSARVSRGFDSINKRNYAVLQDILLNDQSISPFLKRFFSTCMDTEAIEKGSTLNLLNLYMIILYNNVQEGTWDTTFKTIGWLHTMKFGAFWDFHVEVDAGTPSNYLGQFNQGGLNLPDRSLYLDTDERTVRIRALYKQHITNMFKLLNFDNAESRADQVIRLETALATISSPNSDLRDPFKTYNKMSVSEIRSIAGNINWNAYLNSAFLNNTNTFNLINPNYFKNLSSIISTFSLEQVANYLRWDFIHGVAEYLPARFVNENFNFYGKVLLGEDAMPSRSDECIKSTEESVGFLLAQYFVKRVFSGDSKRMALDMLHKIEEVFKNILLQVSWMDEVTRQRALTKLALVSDMIGYPNEWPVYNFNVTELYMSNKIAANIEAFMKDRNSLTQKVNKGNWGMFPTQVNAYYEPTMNTMCFPAAILQNPFFDQQFPSVMNYGGIGMVIGHELSHGFDDQGRLYTGEGKLENWWTKEVSERYDVKAQCLVKQYSGYELLPGYFVNGENTLGENIADNAGIKDAYSAIVSLLGPELTKTSIVPIFNNEQLFFVSFAQTWCTKAREEFMKQRLVTDVHSPPKFRVIGPLSNLPAFANAFHCPAGSKMNPSSRCELF